MIPYGTPLRTLPYIHWGFYYSSFPKLHGNARKLLNTLAPLAPLLAPA